jgi:hypothetical protein
MRVSSSSTHGGHRFPQTRVEAYNTLLLEFFRTHSERDVQVWGDPIAQCEVD